MKACDPGAVVWRTDMLLYNRKHLNALRENALHLARPEAAVKILEATLIGSI